MDPALFEQLLHEEEGPALDFKRDQYPFAKASDDEKSEILKDILGFANNWRRSDAYILIGVQDVRGGRSQVIGVSEQLHDHALQQFVNHLTNRPLRFQYEAFSASGLQVGVIRIELQDRPFYLKRDFGKLKKGEVYVRRGSSTDPTTPATPDEIAQMGRYSTPALQVPELTVEFADPDRNARLGANNTWDAVLLHAPRADELPRYSTRGDNDPYSLLEFSGPVRTNSAYYCDFREYAVFHAKFRPTRLAIVNTGTIAAADVRVELDVPHDSNVQLCEWSDAPGEPSATYYAANVPVLRHIRSAHRTPGDISITQYADRAHLEVDCAGVQPGRIIWSQRFYIAATRSSSVTLNGQVFAATLPEPKAFALTIDAHIEERELASQELIDHALEMLIAKE